MSEIQPSFVTCCCQHCAGHIQFDASHAGESVACPHCESETRLFVPRSQTPQQVFTKPPLLHHQLKAPAGLKCPFCLCSDRLIIKKTITPTGWILFLLGLCLCPILIGIPLIFIGVNMTERKYQCGNCQKIF